MLCLCAQTASTDMQGMQCKPVALSPTTLAVICAGTVLKCWYYAIYVLKEGRQKGPVASNVRLGGRHQVAACVRDRVPALGRKRLRQRLALPNCNLHRRHNNLMQDFYQRPAPGGRPHMRIWAAFVRRTPAPDTSLNRNVQAARRPHQQWTEAIQGGGSPATSHTLQSGRHDKDALRHGCWEGTVQEKHGLEAKLHLLMQGLACEGGID